jgi:hypothetical protein
MALGPLSEKRRLRAAEKTDWDHLPPDKITAWYKAVDAAYHHQHAEATRHGKKIILQDVTILVRVMDKDDL